MKKYLMLVSLAIAIVFLLVSFTPGNKNSKKGDVQLLNKVAYTRYEIVSSTDNFQFRTTIEEKMREGWQPLGGVAIVGDRFHQAMAR